MLDAGLRYGRGVRIGWLWGWWRRKKTPVYWSQLSAPAMPKPPSSYPGSLTSEFVRFTVDRTGFAVRRKRLGAGGMQWMVHLELTWTAVSEMRFDNDGRDPVMALYAVTTGGQRRYMMDSKHLSQDDWGTLATMVAGASGGLVTVDLASRDTPRSITD